MGLISDSECCFILFLFFFHKDLLSILCHKCIDHSNHNLLRHYRETGLRAIVQKHHVCELLSMCRCVVESVFV